jgi:hypothetical protein
LDILNTERVVATAVLGILDPGTADQIRDFVRHDPHAAPLTRQMRQTLGAIKLWQGEIDRLAAPAIPEPRRIPLGAFIARLFGGHRR